MMGSRHMIIIVMQWVVIAVLVAGGSIAVLMAEHKTADFKKQLENQKSNVNSLREQVRQARNPTSSPVQPLPEASANAAPSPSITPKPVRP